MTMLEHSKALALVVAGLTAAFAIGPDGPSQQCRDDAGPPFGDLDYVYHRNTPAVPILQTDGTCPPPLVAACASKGVKRAYLEGPLQCGGRGWFCRIYDKAGWVNPYYDDRNFENCNVDGADEKDQGGHCHGSDTDDVYGWWVRDHWFRGYAGTLQCCCDWGNLKGLVNRCDYRKHVTQQALDTCRDANEEHNKGYEGTCGAYANVPFSDPVTEGSDQCWTVEYFADPEAVPNPDVKPVPTPAPPTTRAPTTKQPTTRTPTRTPTTKTPTKQPTAAPTTAADLTCPLPTGPTDSTPAPSGFDWGGGCAAGLGCFTKSLPVQSSVETVGVIPAGKYDVFVRLEAMGDIDVRLFDSNYRGANGQWPEGEGQAIVAWCGVAGCNGWETIGMSPGSASTTYDRDGTIEPMVIEYSGYNGQNGNPGDEFIRITGVTTTDLTMRVFAYATGNSRVTYSWGESRSDCCAGTAPCVGAPFKQPVAKDGVLDVGTIPSGKRDVSIRLVTADGSDVDVQLFDTTGTESFDEGKAIIAWCASPLSCNLGVMNGPNFASARYPSGGGGLLYSWTGYNGQNGNLGDEQITVQGTTDRELLMRVFGYAAGEAEVTYSWWEEPSASRGAARRGRESGGKVRGRG